MRVRAPTATAPRAPLIAWPLAAAIVLLALWCVDLTRTSVDLRAGLGRRVGWLRVLDSADGSLRRQRDSPTSARIEDPSGSLTSLLIEISDASPSDPLRAELERLGRALAVADASTVRELGPSLAAVEAVIADVRRAIRGETAAISGELEVAWERLGLAAFIALGLALANLGLVLLSSFRARRSSAIAEELRVAKREVEAASQAKSNFLAMMSHEIRTPLNGVLGMAGVLADTQLSGDQREYLGIVRSSAESLLALLNDVLDYSKLEASKMAIEETRVDVRHVVDDVLTLHSGSARAKGLDLFAIVEPTIPAHLTGDPARLRQGLSNLVANAIKFTKRGSAVIRVEIERSMEEAIELRFVVIDTGIGVDPAALGHVFEAFTQASSATSRRHGGSGLGLALVRQLARAMGGEAGATSTPDEGSSFWFTARLQLRSSGAAVPRAAAPRVLCAERSALGREAIEAALTGYGCVVESVSGGHEALAALALAHASDRPFDVLVADAELPELGGIELLRELRARPAISRTPLVILGPIDLRGIRGTGLNLGVVYHVARPMRLLQLRDRVLAALKDDAIAEAGVSVQRRRGRILVVDDSSVNQKITALMLANRGYAVDTVGNGVEAVNALEQVPYDLVLMDCEMPEMDGYAATARIRARERSDHHTPIVAMTGRSDLSSQNRCLDVGMDECLTKPVRPDELDQVLDRRLIARAGDEVGDPAASGEAGDASG